MRTDIKELNQFYGDPFGQLVRETIVPQLTEIWGSCAQLDVAGFGFCAPFLPVFSHARRVVAIAPGGQGVSPWPNTRENAACLSAESRWPLADASVDRLLIMHGLEETPQPRRLMREAWRVLADDGRLIVVVANRRGPWSMADTTPFSAGRPYSRRQLKTLMEESLFRITAWSTALHFPPLRFGFLRRAAPIWERAGARVWPALGGVLMAEAQKDMMVPTGLVRARSETELLPRPLAARPLQSDAQRCEVLDHNVMAVKADRAN